MPYLIVKFTLSTKYIALFKGFYSYFEIEEQNTNFQSQNCNLLLIID